MLISKSLKQEAIAWLKALIAIPSFSKNEEHTATRIGQIFQAAQIPFFRKGNNIWSISPSSGKDLPVVLLNSHHDTVRPVAGWSKSPFEPVQEANRLYGLGSNDAGASLVSLLATFLHFYTQNNLPFQLLFAATAEEEISGSGGIASLLSDWPKIDLGIIGEPTQMQMAVTEKGLLVIDAVAQGKAGHAAREEGQNAIYRALEDIAFLQQYQFPKIDPYLGPVKTTVTQIQAGTQHNVVPDQCHFVIDVRSNGAYSNAEIFTQLQHLLQAKLTARSLRLNSSQIPVDHPVVQRAKALGLDTFGSATLSDQALLPFPTVKIGPGDSARSHTADEFIYPAEIEAGIEQYAQLLVGLKLKKSKEIVV